MIEYENLAKLNKPFETAFKSKYENFIGSGWYILGKNVQEFEQEFARYLSVKYCVGVANGLDALLLSIIALGLPKDSEILVPSNTYIATILAIINAGMKPVLVEPDIRTYNIDPTKIEEQITLKTKAIMVVHLYGKTCKMDEIMALATAYNLKVIEDCAQSHGSMYKQQKSGTFGDCNAFSFYPTQNLGALGDAGAVVTNDDLIYDRLKKLRNYGSSVKYVNDLVGYNSRLDEIQAGFLIEKLKKLDDINNHKRMLAKIYLENLTDKVVMPVVSGGYFDVYHIFNIRTSLRDKLKLYLIENGITTDIHYPIPPHRQKAMKDILNYNYPISEEIHRTTLSLPISYFHSQKDILKVCKAVNNFFEITI